MNQTIRTGVSTVTCVQASKCFYTGKEIFTLELEYPRAVHAQLLTHGAFSKNSSSTRAVPLEAAIKQILTNPAHYIWTENQSGMQGAVITDPDKLAGAERLFHIAKMNMIHIARNLSSKRSWGQNIHKQNAGRLLEPFQNIKIVLTSTEWVNWDWLRDDPDAQGEIADLAHAIKEARDTAEIMVLKEDEWHVPYVERLRIPISDGSTYIKYKSADGVMLSTEEAKAVSSSVCAQISYRKADYALEKASKMKGMLIDGRKVHASPFEHQATPVGNCKGLEAVNIFKFLNSLPLGVTHVRRDGEFGSGNFIGWIQHRQLIKNHDRALFKEE
jgi:hypothetical protein